MPKNMLTTVKMLQLNAYLKEQKEFIEREHPTTEQMAGLASSVLKFPVTKANVQQLAKIMGIRFDKCRARRNGYHALDLQTITVSLLYLFRKLGEEPDPNLLLLRDRLSGTLDDEEKGGKP